MFNTILTKLCRAVFSIFHFPKNAFGMMTGSILPCHGLADRHHLILAVIFQFFTLTFTFRTYILSLSCMFDVAKVQNSLLIVTCANLLWLPMCLDSST